MAAGLVPQLRSGAIAGSADWPIVTLVPGAHPLRTWELRSPARWAALSSASEGDGSDEHTDFLWGMPDMPVPSPPMTEASHAAFTASTIRGKAWSIDSRPRLAPTFVGTR